MIPVVALVGRPNVGKSTLFNRLTKSSGEEEGIDVVMADQSLLAMEEADVVLFLVDSRDGVTSADTAIAKHLRSLNKATYLVANKVDGLNHDVATAAFYELGLGEVHGIAAAHGRGVNVLMRAVFEHLPEQMPESEKDNENAGIKIGVVGRPNVGKSTLVNRLLGEDRVVVFDMPGTTRDSVYISYERHGKPYTLIDTAGIRRRKNIKLSVEKFSIVKTLQAISDANVVVLMMDASEGLVEQDLQSRYREVLYQFFNASFRVCGASASTSVG